MLTCSIYSNDKLFGYLKMVRQLCGNRDFSFCIETMLRSGKFGITVGLQIRVENFLFATTSSLTLGFTQPLMQTVSERLYAEGQSPWREADHSSLNSAEFKNV